MPAIRSRQSAHQKPSARALIFPHPAQILGKQRSIREDPSGLKNPDIVEKGLGKGIFPPVRKVLDSSMQNTAVMKNCHQQNSPEFGIDFRASKKFFKLLG